MLDWTRDNDLIECPWGALSTLVRCCVSTDVSTDVSPKQFFLLTLIVSLLGGLAMDISRIVTVIISYVKGAVSSHDLRHPVPYCTVPYPALDEATACVLKGRP